MKCSDCNIKPRIKGRTICYACKSRRYAISQPIRVAYHRLKGHAKARGKEFSISFEYFQQFCTQVEYIAKRGRSSTSFHIDRIKEELGYVEGNLQVLENAENVKKYKRWVCLDQDNRSVFKTTINKPPDESLYDDCPF